MLDLKKQIQYSQQCKSKHGVYTVIVPGIILSLYDNQKVLESLKDLFPQTTSSYYSIPHSVLTHHDT